MDTAKAAANKPTFEEQFGEMEDKYWQKRNFLDQTLQEITYFLKLKDLNSVRVVFTIDVDRELKQEINWTFSAPVPILVRMRISRLQTSEHMKNHECNIWCHWCGCNEMANVPCEWRIADTAHEMSSANIKFSRIYHHSYPKGERPLFWRFFETHYGKDYSPSIAHFPNVTRIRVRIVMREPLGVLAILDGDSEKVVSRNNMCYPQAAFNWVADASALMEP